MHSSLSELSPSLDAFDRFFADAAIQSALVGVMAAGALVVFELEVDGETRAWMVRHDEGRLAVLPPDGSGTDCVLRCTGADFRALLTGALSPRQGFLERRLRVEGDVGIVLELRRALRRATDRESA